MIPLSFKLLVPKYVKNSNVSNFTKANGTSE